VRSFDGLRASGEKKRRLPSGDTASGQSGAVTLHGYAETAFGWFGKSPRISYKPNEEWISGRCANHSKR
jgi:hypothetical protein